MAIKPNAAGISVRIMAILVKAVLDGALEQIRPLFYVMPAVADCQANAAWGPAKNGTPAEPGPIGILKTGTMRLTVQGAV